MEKHIIFNIGRQFGSGGKSIANRIGQVLGIPVYDGEILSEAARQSGISPEFFEKQDEKRRSWGIGSIFGANRYASGYSTGSGINDAELFRIQSETIREIASRGNAIFVGRASDYVLRDLDCCVDVFICAPVEARVERIRERLGIDSDEKAAALIEKRDKGRAEYYNFFTQGHWGKSSGYDICIDSSILGIEGTADLIIDFAKRSGKL
ncbi:MAG: cytidylate kinase-like family protein [Bacteroidales bacterium]|nr:cytidylate kinase-like family protein [Candidatus Cryptobacteroides aphodequi]